MIIMIMLELIITVWTSCSQRRRQKSGIVCSWWMFFSQIHWIHYHSLLYPYLHDILHDKYIFFYLWVLAQDEFWQWEESGNPAGVDVVGTLLIIIQNHHDYRGHNNYFHDYNYHYDHHYHDHNNLIIKKRQLDPRGVDREKIKALVLELV